MAGWPGMGLLFTVTPEHRLEIEILRPRAHLEADPRRAVLLEHQLAVAEYAMDEVDRRGVEHDALPPPPEHALQVGFEIELRRVQGRRRWMGVEDRHVDVAVGS